MGGFVPRAQKLRALHLNSLLNGGGTDDQCVKLAGALARRGYEVRLAGPPGRRFSRSAEAAGISFDPVPPSKWGFILGAARLLRRGSIDIVHAHHGRDYWPAIIAAALSGVNPRIVLTRHMAKSPVSWASRHFLLSRCDAMVAVSEFVAKVLREGAFEPDSPNPERRHRPPLRGDHSRIQVISNGVDTDRFRPYDATNLRQAWGLDPKDFAFGIVGSYEFPRGKGQRELLEAAARVRSAVPRARFVIVGRGNMEGVLKADIARLNLTGSARLVPYTDDVPTVMNALDCLVHPQVGTEAFATVVLEAFACGKPVIASRLDGIPEAFTAGSYGELVTPGSVTELATAMISRARTPPLPKTEVDSLHTKIAASFSVGHLAERMVACYRGLRRVPQTVPDTFEPLSPDPIGISAASVPVPSLPAPAK